MPSPFEEIALTDLVKHPKLIVLYAVFIGVGWLGNRLVPDDKDKEISRLETMYYIERRGKDSIQASKDKLYEALLAEKRQSQIHAESDKKTDSLLFKLGRKAAIIKYHNHDH